MLPITPQPTGTSPLPEFDVDGYQQQTWVITYLDTFTLLLGFFIILSGLGQYHFFVPDSRSSETLWQESQVMQDWDSSELLRVYRELNILFESEIRNEQVFLTLSSTEISIRFAGSSFFSSGRAALLDSGKELIVKTFFAFDLIGADRFFVDIEGHTDSLPLVRSAQTIYSTNWELSAARAATIVRYFLELGYPASRLKASGYASTYPLVPDYDAKGRPILSNNDINRRIVFRLFLNKSYDR